MTKRSSPKRIRRQLRPITIHIDVHEVMRDLRYRGQQQEQRGILTARVGR